MRGRNGTLSRAELLYAVRRILRVRPAEADSDMCIDMCIDTCIGMFVDMLIGMCTDTFIDIRIYI